MSRNIEFAKSYFRPPQLFYVFVLQYVDGEQQQRLLGITQRHYKQLALAEEWYENIKSKLCGIENSIGTETIEDALNVAARLYENMTKHGR